MALVRASGLISLEPATNPPVLLTDMGAAPALLLDAALPGGADEGLTTVASPGDEPLNPAGDEPLNPAAAVRGLVSAAVRGLDWAWPGRPLVVPVAGSTPHARANASMLMAHIRSPCKRDDKCQA